MDKITNNTLLLILSFIPFESNNWFCCKLVCKRFYQQCIKAMDPSIFCNYAIRRSCQNGWTKSVEFLIKDSRVDLCVDNNKPIRLACQNGHHEIMRLLVDSNKVDPCAHLSTIKKIFFYFDNDHMVCPGISKEKNKISIDTLKCYTPTNKKAQEMAKIIENGGEIYRIVDGREVYDTENWKLIGNAIKNNDPSLFFYEDPKNYNK